MNRFLDLRLSLQEGTKSFFYIGQGLSLTKTEFCKLLLHDCFRKLTNLVMIMKL